jgi:hypothetical protein
MILRRAPFSQPGADYRARKSALRAPQVSESSYSAGSEDRLAIAVDTLHGAADRLAGLVVIHAHEATLGRVQVRGHRVTSVGGREGPDRYLAISASTLGWRQANRLTRSWALPSALRPRLWPASGSDQGAAVRNVMVRGPTVSGPAG